MMSRVQIKNASKQEMFLSSLNVAKCSPIKRLSNLLYKNSFQNYPSDLTQHDDSLTSLNWLNNINIAMPAQNNDAEERILKSNLTSEKYQNCQKAKHATCNTLLQYFPNKLQMALRNEGLFDPVIRHEYKCAWTSKPPFSYTTLICMSMLELRKPKIALYEIYEWIRGNFLFYRISDSSWQNSVRHNLSLKKCFEKVPRQKDERGKGGFWRINANYTDNLGSNLVKYRRQFQMYASPQSNLLTTSDISSEKNLNSTSTTTSGGIAEDFAAFSKRYSSQSAVLPRSGHRGDRPHIRSLLKKPVTLASLNAYRTVDENAHVVAQVRLEDSPTPLECPDDALLHGEAPYPSIFSLDDFDSTSSSINTDFSTSSHLQSSCSESYQLHLPLDLDDLLGH